MSLIAPYRSSVRAHFARQPTISKLMYHIPEVSQRSQSFFDKLW
jgi:hypothetical protein